MNAVVTPNASPSGASAIGAFMGTPAIGQSDYDADLCLGSSGFSVFALINYHGQQTNVFNTYGHPLFNFTELLSTSVPKNGLGVWVAASGVCYLRYFNGYDGADTSKFHEWGMRSPQGNDKRTGFWSIIAFSKAVSASTVIGSYDGANGAGVTGTGTANVVGTPSKTTTGSAFPARVRYFHSASYFSTNVQTVNALFPGGGAVWVLNREFVQADLNTITASAATLIAAMDSTYIGNLLVRSWSGAQDWTAIGSNSGGYFGTSGVHAR
jgi:hypothetical protein